jgi:5-methylcytosine-specific restriction enzyme subunit McrC
LATPVPHQPSRRHWQTDRNGVADLIVAELVAECRELLRGGLRRDYVPREAVAPVVRGRLDLKPQITRRFGQVDRLHLRTFERETAVWENQLCGVALRAATRIVTNPDLARDAATLAAQFPQPLRPEPVLRKLDRSRYNRLNARYRTAHTWSELVLRGGGVTDLLVDTGHGADSLLLRMSSLWESVVRTMVRDAIGPTHGTVTDTRHGQGITTIGDVESRRPFRPDVLVRFGTSAKPAYVLIDAKYKAYDAKSVASDDVHQLLTYIAGYSATEPTAAAIVYPSDQDATHRRLAVNGPYGRLGTIDVLGLDVREPPSTAAEPLRAFLADASPRPH